ncbi:MAG: BON domain-containing protein [Acidobacteria bacterium]|nr:BON domain-containing protein [Acidobacteriota bacterium]
MHRSNVWLASDIMRDRVRNAAGEDLGKIEDIVINPSTGNILYAVLSFGGILGVGDKLFAIPWSSLNLSTSGDFLILNVPRERLEHAPGFDRQHWPNFADPGWRWDIDAYYGARVQTVRERTVVAEPAYRRGAPRFGLLSAVLLLAFAIGALWFVYLVSTRGWEQARSDISATAETAAYAMRETSNDAALTAKVKTALSLSKRIPAGMIDVDTEDQIVTLRGEVPTQAIRDHVDMVVRDVPGVTQVRNHLYVVNSSQ